MNVSDLLQDSPSQHRKRPSASQHEPSPPTQSMTTSLPSASVSPQSQHQLQHPRPHSLPPQPLPNSQPPYPPQPNPVPYYSPSPFLRLDPAPVHRITPRPPPLSQIQPPSIDATPAMASLQRPSPPSPPPHVHSHAPWGPPLALRQGSSMSNLGPGPASLHARTSHQQQPSAHIKPAMSGSERSPIVQRPHASGSSTPSNIATHSPSTKPLLTASGTLILDKRTADEQKARLAAQAQAQAQAQGSSSGHNPNASMKPRERDRDKDWEQRERERERKQDDMDLIRHVARERGMGAPFDRERDRERVPPQHERTLASSHERVLASPHDRPMPSPHDRSLVSPHDRPIPSPHDRDRPPSHIHKMSSFSRAPPTQGPLPSRVPGHVQQSPPGTSQRMGMGPPPPHDRILPPPHERDRMPLLPHERQPHDRDRLQPQPPHPHSHRAGPPLLPGQGQFQTHPPDWDAARERDRDIAVAREREREMARERDMGVSGLPRDRDLARDKDLERDPTRDPDYGFHELAPYLRERSQRMREASRDPSVLLPQREREAMTQRERDMAAQRDREREMIPGRERERISHEMEGMSMGQREKELREREMHVQRDRVAGLQREGETGSGMPPRAHERDRERDRERRTHSRMPSPHGLGMNVGGAGIPLLSSASTSGPGGPPQHHPLPYPHELARERELQLMNERERELAWEHEREREMERRQHRERMTLAERERIGISLSERERITLSDRDRTVVDRDRAIFERDRMPLERNRMPARDRAVLERERVLRSDRDRAMLERERVLPPEQRDRALPERERGIFEHEHPPGDRERPSVMEPHRLDTLERDRMETFERERERERIEIMERDRERERETDGVSAGGPARDMERERDRDRMMVDAPITERERDERLVGPGADREVTERQRERERLELMERERGDVVEREREHMNPEHHEERRDVERERERLGLLERERDRERFEVLERERIELLERERLEGLDVMERERLEVVERERLGILERERLEMLERERLEILDRMPSAEELAKARKEREKKPFVSLGTYVWPRTPFPYYFPEWIPAPVAEGDKAAESKATEAGSTTSSLAPSSLPQPAPTSSPVHTELRLTVLIPPSFLPPARPSKFRLWGGGLPPPPPFPPAPSTASFSRRRVYTDDSDVIQCAVHAGLLTWSSIARAKREHRTIHVVLALVPTLASASGVVRGGASDSRTSMNGVNVVNGNTNGHVTGTTSLPRTRTSTPHPPPPASSVPSMSSSTSDSQASGYAGGVWASRFIGGWGEAFYGEASAGRDENAGRMTSFEEAEDDGRGCVSCGWGWGHDGSAFEVISVDVVEQNAHIAPGLGIRNRSQRLAEYAQRRADILGLSPVPSPPLLDVTNTRKKRRLNVDLTEIQRAGASEIAAVAEEARRMETMTISFGGADQGKSKTGVGFKYDPRVIQCALFPHLDRTSIVGPPPCKRRRVAIAQKGQGDGDVEMDSVDDPQCGVILESTKETYLVTRVAGDGKPRYTLSVFGSLSSIPSALDGKPTQLPLPTPSTPLVDPNPKSLDTPKASLPEPPAEKPKTSTDDPPSAGAVIGPPKPDISPDSRGTGKGKEAYQPTASSTPPSISPLPAQTSEPKPSIRVLRSNLTDTSFTFKDDIIFVRKNDEQTKDNLDAEITMDEDDLKVRVLRWKWYLEV